MAAPANDNFANAEVVTLAADGTYTSAPVPSTGATLETGEPFIGVAGSPDRTIWFAYTPDADGILTVSTEQSTVIGNYVLDTIIGVYTGADLASLVLVASNDDAPEAASPNWWSKVSLPVAAGVTHYVQVGMLDENNANVNYVVGFSVPGSVGTDTTSDVSFGYSYSGTGDVADNLTPDPVPAEVRIAPIRRVHHSLPAPTLVNGRPT